MNIPEEDICFHHRQSPDFIVTNPDGQVTGYEVKRPNICKHIFFSFFQHKKIKKLGGKAYVVIMTLEKDYPLEVIDYDELEEKERQEIRGFKVHIKDFGKEKNGVCFGMRLKPEIWYPLNNKIDRRVLNKEGKYETRNLEEYFNALFLKLSGLSKEDINKIVEPETKIKLESNKKV